MLVIHDETLAKQVQQLAASENRPVEEVLKSMLAQYSPQTSPTASEQVSKSEGVQRVLRKAYAKARRYWESVGDADKAALTDAQLQELFGAFDEEGIPRLKSELKSLEPPVGSLAYAAKIIREQGGVNIERPIDASKADDILNEEFADYLLKRMRGEDGIE